MLRSECGVHLQEDNPLSLGICGYQLRVGVIKRWRAGSLQGTCLGSRGHMSPLNGDKITYT